MCGQDTERTRVIGLSLKQRKAIQAQDAEIETLIRERAKDLFAAFGVTDISVLPDEDHDGDAILSVVIDHRLLDWPVDFKEQFPLDGQLRDAAWEAGDRRFVHIDHSYDDKQQFADFR